MVRILIFLLAFVLPAQAQPPFGTPSIIISGQSNGSGSWMIGQNVVLPAGTHLATLGRMWITPAIEPSASTEESFGGAAYVAYRDNRRTGYGVVPGLVATWRALNSCNRLAITNISKPGSYLVEHMSQKLYGAGKAQTQFLRRSRGPLLARVWIHGEQDSMTEQNASQYFDRAAELFSRWRADDRQQTPIIVVELGDAPNSDAFPHWNTIKLAQRRLAAELPNVEIVRSGGLKKQINPNLDGEGLHYEKQSYDTLGAMIGFAIFRFTGDVACP